MKKSKWVKYRHVVFWKIFYLPIYLVSKYRYKASVKNFPDAKNNQYLILLNHQTAFDQMFVGLSWGAPVYFVGSEDLFSEGLLSKIITFMGNPIPIRKFRQDLLTIRICAQVIKEGGTICIAPEGNTTYSGKTEYIKPGIAKMAKRFKLPIAFYKIEGGYGKDPRWGDNIRTGHIRAGVSKVIYPSDYLKLSDEELLQLIESELFVNDCLSDEINDGVNLAQYIERIMYVCPECGLTEYKSEGNSTTCLKCSNQIIYRPDRTIEGVAGYKFPFTYTYEWYDYQKRYVNSIKVSEMKDAPVYTDYVDVYQVNVYKNKKKIANKAKMELFGNRIVLSMGDDVRELRFDKSFEGCAVLGRNKFNISYDDFVYQFKGDKRFNAVKYINFYYKYKTEIGENKNDDFLGL